MAGLEAEVLLLGIWKNVEDLEESLSLPELQAILEASREKEHRQNKFMAALKGIDLDENDAEDSKKRFDEVQRRAETRLYGEKNVTASEYDFFGLDIETEEE